MGNGMAGYGSVAAQMEHDGGEPAEGKLAIRGCWSHSGNWLELAFFPHGQKMAQCVVIDTETGGNVDLAALLLESLGKDELAEQLRDESEKLKQQDKIRRLADGEFRRAIGKAEKRFLEEASPQREAFAAAVKEAEKAYEDATGESLRASGSVEVLDRPRF